MLGECVKRIAQLAMWPGRLLLFTRLLLGIPVKHGNLDTGLPVFYPETPTIANLDV